MLNSTGGTAAYVECAAAAKRFWVMIVYDSG
jgi:hypothetical protein